MKGLGVALVLLVALEHVYFLYLEMFLWTRPKGLKRPEFMSKYSSLVA